MKQLVKKIIAILPYGKAFLNWYGRFQLNRLARSHERAGGVFSFMYKSNLWGNQESVSGPGSTLEYTENIRRELPVLFRNLEVKSILDAPCGDYNWFRHVDRESSINYLGADIVPELIDRNSKLHANANTRFAVLDIRQENLPAADLWLCRDVLFHLSNQDVVRVIKNFLRSDIPYLLTSSHTQCEKNIDIPTGSFRLLNLEKAPFNFCRPMQSIDDWIEGFPERRLCLWKRSDLESCLKENELFASRVKN